MSETKTMRYCANGCTRIGTDDKRHPVEANTGQLCSGCTNRLATWLRQIPERYALVPQYLLPSAEINDNPTGGKKQKSSATPVPVRLAALDLLDERRGRKWLGTVPADERRGTLGTLLAISNEIRDRIGSKRKMGSHVIAEADYILTNLVHLAHSDGIAETYTELKTLHRQLGDAIGEFPPKPVGTCPVVPADADLDDKGNPEPCAGPLLPIHTGVLCARCGTRWDHEHLRLLGRSLEATA